MTQVPCNNIFTLISVSNIFPVTDVKLTNVEKQEIADVKF